jgi:hypothetical protein
LAESLAGFRNKLRVRAEALDIAVRQQILRLLVKEVLVGGNTITLRHSIPIPQSGPGSSGSPAASSGVTGSMQNPGYIFCVRGVNSPLLSNLVLDELDRELERRGHRFVRYADDCNLYVRSERAGQRVMESVTQFITQKLKLKVNEAKSAVARPQERKFLGFSFSAGPEVKRVIAPKALDRFKQRIREITRRAKGVSLETTMEELAPYMRGWRSYFGFCETPEC